MTESLAPPAGVRLKFCIERAPARASALLAAALPLLVDVRVERRVAYPSACSCKVTYRLTDEATAELRRGNLIRIAPLEPNPCVCDCLGTVVPETPPYRTVRQLREGA